jgi:hypothetical protein
LRLSEALQLRVKDLHFEYRQVIVRSAKGAKDRSTILPEILLGPLQQHLENVKLRHEAAIRNGHAGVELPFALERKYPHAYLEWGWQYVFPAERPSRDPRTGAWRRHHVYPDSVQRQVKAAVKAAGILKPRARLRHPHRAGVARAQGREDDADLHAWHAQGRECGAESVGLARYRGAEGRRRNRKRGELGLRALRHCAPRWGHRDGALKRAIAVSNVANATLSNLGTLGSPS